MITLDQGVVIAGRYTLVRPLAKGGMGSVWIARHRDLEIDVTVKFMAPSLVAEADARIRFEREARVAARLRSQHVVQVHDYGVEDETPYIIMELLKGESLATRLEREGRLPAPVLARLLVQICKALRTAHEAGLVHRDLKPGNVFLALKDDDEVVKVLDFGIAKTGTLGEAQADTDSGVLLGSVHYMSPEQIRSSRDVDQRSDLWSVAVILYRVLTGRLPFPGANLGDVLVRVCTDAPPAPSSMAPDLSARIDGFFERALARDPEQRFQSAPELAEAFAAVAHDPPTPRVITPAPRATVAAPTPPLLAPTPPLFAPTPPRIADAPPPPSPAPLPFSPPRAAPALNQTVRMQASSLVPARAPTPSSVGIGAPAATTASAASPRTIVIPAPVAPFMPIPAAPPVIPLDPARRALAAPADARPAARSRWPVWAVVGTVTLAVILALALRYRGTSAAIAPASAPGAGTRLDTGPAAPSGAHSAVDPAPTGPVAAEATTDAVASAVAPGAPSLSPPGQPPRSTGPAPKGAPRPRRNPLDRSD
ncbi:MAG: serine/threonine-protein kinase [Byssovorax sp.]